MSDLSLEERIEGIRKDQIHGAAFLAREALRALQHAIVECPAEDRQQVQDRFLETARRLLALRPSMPAVGHVVVRATEMARDRYLAGLEAATLRDQIGQGIEQLIVASRKAHEDAVRFAVNFLKEGTTVVTLSLSSNVQDTLIRAAPKVRRVFVGETRPMNEGQELARLLAEARVPVTLMTDAALGQALEKADLCLVGADGVLQDGSLVNKTGTYLLALAAQVCQVPVYSICETLKYHVGAIPFEAEHKAPGEVCEPIPGVEIANCYFEIVPPKLIKGYITELGVLNPHIAVQQLLSWQKRLSGKRLFGEW